MGDVTRIGLADEPGLTGADGPIIDAGPAVSAEDAARWLARDGWELADARALVRRYQDEASARLGLRVHGWGLDAADLTAIRASATTPAGAVPAPRAAPGAESVRRAQLARWHADDAQAAGEDVHVREWL